MAIAPFDPRSAMGLAFDHPDLGLVQFGPRRVGRPAGTSLDAIQAHGPCVGCGLAFETPRTLPQAPCPNCGQADVWEA